MILVELGIGKAWGEEVRRPLNEDSPQGKQRNVHKEHLDRLVKGGDDKSLNRRPAGDSMCSSNRRRKRKVVTRTET